MPSDDLRKRLRQWIEESQRVVAFTGAGISTESGIPDFRSPGGIWTKVKPIYFEEFLASEAARRESWRRKLADRTRGAEPNRGHFALTELFLRGRLSSVITQNIDGLHQAAGIPDDRVIELHGNGSYAKCLQCERRYELEPVLAEFRRTEQAPLCECGGLIKTATISFGQALPPAQMQRAEQEALACDLFLTLGSSLVVFPAAGYPLLAKQHGARLVILNREPTEMDGLADLVIHDEIGPTMSDVVPLA